MAPQFQPPRQAFLSAQPAALLRHSVTQSCLSLGDPVDHSTPGFPVHHRLPEFAQTGVHRVHDAIQPSRPLLHFRSDKWKLIFL